MDAVEKLRKEYQNNVPDSLKHVESLTAVESNKKNRSAQETLDLFPHTHELPFLEFRESKDVSHKPLRVGVVLSGGQASGGHNVIIGLFDALKKMHSESKLFGFLDGPDGIIKNNTIELTDKLLADYRNTGGFDMIGSGRTKIETPEQFEMSKHTTIALKLDGIVVIGGDDSNTNAAMLAEYFIQNGVEAKVIGVPKTIDGDLKNEDVEISFGFDTATKTYSALIGNILRDALSAKKYYFFIKLMGRSASHIVLECAFQTQPNLALIGEDVEKKKKTFHDLVRDIADMICKRADSGKHYGVVLIPEGILEFIDEFKHLISELNRLQKLDKAELRTKLTQESRTCFQGLPVLIQEQLLLDRDPHGNVKVSQIETERLFIDSVTGELKKRKAKGEYSGKFSSQPLFYGYDGRSCLPTNFDANYCYSLGYAAALLIDSGKTGYMSCIKHLSKPVENWIPAGVPLTSMIHLEERKGKVKPVIKKALVDLEGKPFQQFKKVRESWRLDDQYLYPSPIQFFGPNKVTDSVTKTLELEQCDS